MAELSRWSQDEYVRRPGDKRFEFPAMPQFGLSWLDKGVLSADPYWVVEGSFGERSVAPNAAASFGHCKSFEEAQEQLAELLTHTDRDGRLTDWVITENVPTITSRVVHREPVREPINVEETA